MMLLILMGRFEVGDHLDNNMEDFLPVHKVELDAFYIDIYEVTIGQFKKFVSQTGYGLNRWNDVSDCSQQLFHGLCYVD